MQITFMSLLKTIQHVVFQHHTSLHLPNAPRHTCKNEEEKNLLLGTYNVIFAD